MLNAGVALMVVPIEKKENMKNTRQNERKNTQYQLWKQTVVLCLEFLNIICSMSEGAAGLAILSFIVEGRNSHTCKETCSQSDFVQDWKGCTCDLTLYHK